MIEHDLWKKLIEAWIQHREIELGLLRELRETIVAGRSPQSEAEPVGMDEVLARAGEVPLTSAPGASSGWDPASFPPEVRESISAPEPAPVPAVADAADAANKPPATIPLLLIADAQEWVGFPWDCVDRVALTEEVGLSPESSYRFSLGAVLQQEVAEEPYALIWNQDGGRASLSCSRIGGIVAAPVAAERGVGLVVLPRRHNGDPRPSLMTLEEYLGLDRTEPPRLWESAEGGANNQALDGQSNAALDGQRTETLGEAGDSSAPGAESFAPELGLADTDSDCLGAVIPDSGGLDSDHPEGTIPDLANSPPALGQKASDPRTVQILVAINYLPARVAITRMLRGVGWTVREEPQPELLPRHFADGFPDVLFLEPVGALSSGVQESLEALVARGGRVVVVGSRLRPGQAAPEGILGTMPRLHFPFTEDESRALLQFLRPRSDQVS